MKQGLASLYRRWLAFGERVGHVVSRVFLTVFYFIAVLPLGLLVGGTSDLLRCKKPYPTQWHDWSGSQPTMEEARSQG